MAAGEVDPDGEVPGVDPRFVVGVLDRPGSPLAILDVDAVAAAVDEP